MFRPKDEILALFSERKKARSPFLSRIETIRQSYNNEGLVLPLPEINGLNEPAVANVMIQGIDQTGARISSVLPDLDYPPLKPGIKKSEDYAKIRRNANLGWYEMNSMDVKMGRRARHLIAYASSPVVLRPDFKRGIPLWEPRNPIGCLPAETVDPDDVNVSDCIFTFSRALGWIKAQYPQTYNVLNTGRDPKPGDLYTCLEYIDENEHSMFVVGKDESHEYWGPGGQRLRAGGQDIQILQRAENRAGVCTAVVAGRVSLDRPRGQFDDMSGMFAAQARLTALEIIAVERGIFPRTYLIERPGEAVQVITPAIPETGQMGVVKGGDIKDMALNPGFQTNPTIDRLERAQRLAGGIPAEYGGESPSNVRTGRRGESVLSSTIDFPISEAQKMFARSLMEENVRAIAIAKGYFGSQPKSFWVSWKGAKGQTTYTPNTHFETNEHSVVYSLPGSDANGLTIRVGQGIGIGIMSKQRGMELEPLVDDVEREKDRMVVEGLEAALLGGLQAQAAAPDSPIPVTDLARIMMLVRQDKMDLALAIDKVQKEAQARQASVTPEGQPDVVPPGSPEAMPGMAAPGQGAEAAAGPPPEEPGEGVADLSKLLFTLRSSQRQSPAERAPVA